MAFQIRVLLFVGMHLIVIGFLAVPSLTLGN